MKNSTLILKRAKSLLENVGWCQGTYFKGEYPDIASAYCAVGAVDEAIVQLRINGENITSDDETNAARYLKSIVAPSKLISFNDRLETTKEMILAVFDRAIAESEKE